MALRSSEVLTRLFGPEGPPAEDPYWLLRQAMSETGNAVLERLLREGAVASKTLAELYGSFAVKPDVRDIEARLGIENITTTLMIQRFEEDLEAIAKFPRTEIL